MNLDNDRDLAATLIALAAHIISARAGAKMITLHQIVANMQKQHEAGGTAEEILSCLQPSSQATTLKEDLEFELVDMDREVLTRMGNLLHRHRGGHVSGGLIFTAAEVAEMLAEVMQ